jgi:hypothetical protein
MPETEDTNPEGTDETQTPADRDTSFDEVAEPRETDDAIAYDNTGQPDLNVAEANELEINEHGTITGTAPVRNLTGTGTQDLEEGDTDVDPALYVGTRSWNSETISTTYVKKFTIRRADWEAFQADETYERDQHNANITGTRLAALQTGLVPVENSGSFVGTEDLPEDNLSLVYQVEVVPNNDDAPQTYVNPRDVEKGLDLSEPAWAPLTSGESRRDPDLQDHNDPEAQPQRPEPLHISDIEAERNRELNNG